MRIAACLALFLLSAPAVAPAATPTDFIDELRASGLSEPVGMAFLPDGRLLVVEQFSAAIKMVRNGVVSTLTVVPNVQTGGEQGLLGIAVDPRWPFQPHIYVHYTFAELPGTIRISRFTLSGDLTNTENGSLTLIPGLRYDLITDIANDFTNHNGGTVRFGPDGMLYVSLGEDARACLAQDSTELNGKILRLDVTRLPITPGGPPARSLITPPDNPFVNHPNANARLVWAMGLRNPFRFHIDAPTGDLFIADVGQSAWEEIDHATGPGLNFGWPWREGPDPLGACGSGPTTGFTPPIHAFDHDIMTVAISAGLYRRNGGALQFPYSYEGDYFFSSYYDGALYRLKESGGSWFIAPQVPGQTGLAWATGLQNAADFAIGPDGGLWYCRQGVGTVRRISFIGVTAVDPAPLPGPDPEDRAYYDLQGRRVDEPKQNGLYFTRDGRRKVVLR